MEGAWIDPSARPQEQMRQKTLFFLRGILQDCRTRSQQISGVQKTVRDMIDILIEKMKEDPIFLKAFVEYRLRGSVQNKLKVLKPNEFDVDAIFQIPLHDNPNNNSLLVVHSEEYPSWAECKISSLSLIDTNSIVCKRNRKFKRKLFDVEGRLVANGLRGWIHGCLVKALRSVEKESLNAKVPGTLWSDLTVQFSGPAITVTYAPKAKTSTDIRPESIPFSFDFVPVITVPDYCKDEIRQSVTSKHVPVEPDDLRDMYLVPVQPRVAPNDPEPPNYLLRLSIPLLESKLLAHKENLKDIIRLIKILLAKNTWNPISSYAVVNLCVGLNLSMKREDLDKDFFLALESLSVALKAGNIPLAWSPGCNLIVKLNEEFRTNVRLRLDKFLRRSSELLTSSEKFEKRFFSKTLNSLSGKVKTKRKSVTVKDTDAINKELKKAIDTVSNGQVKLLYELFQSDEKAAFESLTEE